MWKYVIPLLFLDLSIGMARADDVLQGTVWHPIAMTFEGPMASERQNHPNPYLDVRLQVQFTGPSGNEISVPGFFDGDGRSGPDGKVWKVRFSPNEAGTWKYHAQFRRGKEVAIDLDPDAGEVVELPHLSGTLEVSPRDEHAPGFLKWGMLRYANSHYLKFDNGPHWIRGGVDEPENFLAYQGFVNTPSKHKYADHGSDWKEGDPDWNNGDGRAIIGALNYLAKEHVNSIYFLTMNVGGDGKDVWPWVGPINPKGSPDNDNLHFDTNKLRQWEIVFDHAQRLGIFLHIVFNEAEKANKQELDNGDLGPERKLYYREMIARFGHHLALEWNICEEYNLDFDFGPDRIRSFADYIRAVDPYDHPITVHTAGDPVEALRFTYGDKRFDLTSIQLNQRPIHDVTESIYRETEKVGRPLPFSLDEFTLDRGQKASHIPVDDAEGHRREKLWPTYFSGGMIEFILDDLLKTDSFKTPEREKLWQYVWYARHFMEENLPFWEMQPADELCHEAATVPLGIGKGQKIPLGPQVFAKKGEVYAVYYPTASNTGRIDLRDLKGNAEAKWFNPRNGKFEGAAHTLKGGFIHHPGAPPATPEHDWVLLIKRVSLESTEAKHFPGEHWEERTPESLGLDSQKFDEFAQRMGGDGCIVRDGYLVKRWGNIDTHNDWASAAKPVLSTLLLLAVEKSRLDHVDVPVAALGWSLSEKDQSMTFRHLANMTSGYSCGEAPGDAWGYNDFAIQLYAKSLEKVFACSLNQTFHDNLADLEFEDGEFFGSRHGLGVSASPRDFARLAWFWMNKGTWNEKTIVNRALFDESIRPGVAASLPRTCEKGSDYLAVGSYGGGTNQTPYGPGCYGFNFWFNERTSNGLRVWPGLPADTYQANGMWNRDTVTIMPSLRMVVIVRGGSIKGFEPGNPTNEFNQTLRLISDGAGHLDHEVRNDQQPPPDVRGFSDGAHHWYKIKDDSRVIRAASEQPRFNPAQVTEIADNILIFQRANGGWPKDYDMLAMLTSDQKKAVLDSRNREDTSFDNHNIHSQVDYLARAFVRLKTNVYRDACLRGFDFILDSQYSSGGFPQRYPNPKGYAAHITFNDGVTIGNLNVLKDAGDKQAHWEWLDEERRIKARHAVDRGIECILKCRIQVNDQIVGWCQQHDEDSYQAVPARTFELASICPQDSTEIIRFLMRLENPNDEIQRTIQQSVAWLKKVKIDGIRTEKVAAPPIDFERHRSDFDVVVIEDPKSRPIWARHYEIGTDRPVFAGRDAIKRYSLAEIERERRTGTPWYGYWPESLIAEEYPAWKEKHRDKRAFPKR
ncbi:pectate lyase [bacterium]|nr:pectate lyase [bacterium]